MRVRTKRKVSAGADSGSDHADWADAKLLCTGELAACPAAPARLPAYGGYELVWQDEFDVDGPPNPGNWSFANFVLGTTTRYEGNWDAVATPLSALGDAYMLLNLAIGGQAGGDPSRVPFPVHYEVDYVRVYRARTD